MFSQLLRSDALDNTRPQASQPIVWALSIGLTLGCLLALLWPAPSAMAAFAHGLSGLAVGFLGVGLFHQRRSGCTAWGLMIFGQLAAVVAIVLLFAVSLAH